MFIYCRHATTIYLLNEMLKRLKIEGLVIVCTPEVDVFSTSGDSGQVYGLHPGD